MVDMWSFEEKRGIGVGGPPQSFALSKTPRARVTNHLHIKEIYSVYTHSHILTLEEGPARGETCQSPRILLY